MNKKIIVLLIGVFSIIFVIAVSVFGKNPETETTVPVQSIMFVDSSTEDGFCELNENGMKIIYVPRGTTEYQLEYLINPGDATYQNVEFQILTGMNYATVSKDGLLTISYESSITVKIYSDLNDIKPKTDIVIIEFKGNTSTVIPDEEDPF